jgi:NADH:ubiquinone oxidoreductase subunit
MIQAAVMLPNIFGEFALKMFHSLPKAPTIHFVTDTYRQNSIKEQERQRRSVVEYESLTSETKVPRDFKCFLHSSRSKAQLIQFILDEWMTPQCAKLFQQRRIFFANDVSCLSLQSEDGLTVSAVEEPEYATNQEETDTRLILHSILASHELAEDTKLVVLQTRMF